MAILSNSVAAELEATGGPVPIFQVPTLAPSKGQALAAGQSCKWYESGVFTDTQGGIHEVPIGCEMNTTVLLGTVGALALAGWFIFGRKKL
jgi:hypothetical protein